MTDAELTVRIDGEPVRVPPGTMLASLLLQRGRHPRRSVVLGEPRTAVCGMGICYECRATVDGMPQVRTCMVECRDGMEVRCDG